MIALNDENKKQWSKRPNVVGVGRFSHRLQKHAHAIYRDF